MTIIWDCEKIENYCLYCISIQNTHTKHTKVRRSWRCPKTNLWLLTVATMVVARAAPHREYTPFLLVLPKFKGQYFMSGQTWRKKIFIFEKRFQTMFTEIQVEIRLGCIVATYDLLTKHLKCNAYTITATKLQRNFYLISISKEMTKLKNWNLPKKIKINKSDFLQASTTNKCPSLCWQPYLPSCSRIP